MANPARYGGFKPTPLLRSRHYWRISTDATAIFIGDAVEPVSDGTVGAAEAGDNVCTGVSLDYGAASTSKLVAIADNTEQEYIVRDDASGSTTLATLLGYIHNNADHIAGAGSAYTYQSGHSLDLTTPTTTTLTFRVLAYLSYGIDNPEMVAAETYGLWRVRVNETPYSIASNAGV